MSQARWLTIVIIILIALPLAYVIYNSLTEPLVPEGTTNQTPLPEYQVAPEEQNQIEAWIKAHNFNQYGDPADTVYVGGTPLFDERTGERYDRFEYIILNHPDRPWKK